MLRSGEVVIYMKIPDSSVSNRGDKNEHSKRCYFNIKGKD